MFLRLVGWCMDGCTYHDDDDDAVVIVVAVVVFVVVDAGNHPAQLTTVHFD